MAADIDQIQRDGRLEANSCTFPPREAFKSLAGGELKGMTKMLAEGRQHASDRLVQEAEAKGANAVVAFRFDTSELGSTWTEICAYRTAVKARKI